VPELLSELTNYELARLILRQLWQFQDAAGVSMGRSKRSVLLEAALHLLPMPEMHDPDFFRLDDLYNGAKPAWRKAHSAQQLSFPDFRMINNRELATLLLYYLQQWYEDDAKKNPLESLRFERRMLNAVLNLLPPGLHQFDESDLIEESAERHRHQLQSEADERYPTLWASSS